MNIYNRFKKNTEIQNVTNICPVGAEMFHADGRTDGPTDMTKLTVAFRNFANAPKHSNGQALQIYFGLHTKCLILARLQPKS